jgi:hypothetical protein
LPNKHYQGCVIAWAMSRYLHGGASMEEVAAAVGCSRRTIARLVRWIAAVADPAVLAAKLVAAIDTVVLPQAREIAKRLQALRVEARRIIAKRAAQVLALTEALASAMGLEPPGLRAILERSLAGRTDVGTYRRPVIPELARSAQLM